MEEIKNEKNLNIYDKLKLQNKITIQINNSVILYWAKTIIGLLKMMEFVRYIYFLKRSNMPNRVLHAKSKWVIQLLRLYIRAVLSWEKGFEK